MKRSWIDSLRRCQSSEQSLSKSCLVRYLPYPWQKSYEVSSQRIKTFRRNLDTEKQHQAFERILIVGLSQSSKLSSAETPIRDRDKGCSSHSFPHPSDLDESKAHSFITPEPRRNPTIFNAARAVAIGKLQATFIWRARAVAASL